VKLCGDCGTPLLGAANARKSCPICALERVRVHKAVFARQRRARGGPFRSWVVCRDCGVEFVRVRNAKSCDECRKGA